MTTILVVDDELASTDLFRFVLEAAGYRVLTAHHGRAALEMVSREAVDLILSDVMMPVMGGIELCVELQRRSMLPKIPLVLVTAAIEWVRLNGCAAAAVLSKPVDVDELSETIERLLTERTGSTGAAP